MADAYELMLVRSLSRQYLKADGEMLAKLGGASMATVRERFGQVDKELQRLEAERIVAERLRDPAPPGVDYGPKRDWTDLALVKNEIGKSKRHIPIRDLVRRAGGALQALKPVWMVSPASIAQFVPPGTARFDLVLVDEASQMLPEYAVGAIARGAQLVVVGDSRQLPPTTFFDATVDASAPEGDDDADYDVVAESLLDLANERLALRRRLKWHYRSRHESLIAFSNRRFYDSDLIIVPSPTTEDPLLGVKHFYVGGTYEGQINQHEAEAVIEAALGVIYERPDLSVGIATMNFQQRDLIWNEIERLANEDPRLRDYIEKQSRTIEPFFVKNLENVQGDERDVTLISTLYGPDKAGKVFQRFGPLNSKAGHRRLYVLVTRAKISTMVFTSLRPSDIKPTENTNEGVFALQAYLTYAGGGAVVDEAAGGEPDSDFEIFVADRLSAAGYEVVHQVGVESFRTDLGVKHPDFPAGFIAGIECDGASYHSSYTVRDRGRIRQSILEGLGWRIYRIWSTDRFANPGLETSKLLSWLERQREAQAAAWAARPAKEKAGTAPLQIRAGGAAKAAAPTPELDALLSSATPAMAPEPMVAGSPEEIPPAQMADSQPRPPEGVRSWERDGVRWYEVMKGALYEVWVGEDRSIGDIEVLARAMGAPRIYGGTVSTPKPQYRGTHVATGRSFVTDDIYVAVKRLAQLEAEHHAEPALQP